MKVKKNRIIKCPRYKTMKCYDKVKCPHYEGDGYMYKFNRVEFLFCDKCNKTLLRQMVDQFKIEQEIDKLNIVKE